MNFQYKRVQAYGPTASTRNFSKMQPRYDRPTPYPTPQQAYGQFNQQPQMWNTDYYQQTLLGNYSQHPIQIQQPFATNHQRPMNWNTPHNPNQLQTNGRNPQNGAIRRQSSYVAPDFKQRNANLSKPGYLKENTTQKLMKTLDDIQNELKEDERKNVQEKTKSNLDLGKMLDTILERMQDVQRANKH